ncbi:MAG: MATE family efflux transporter [Oscillospiraceae bacterium]
MEEHIQAENKMGVMSIKKLLPAMAVPMMISMMVQALYNVVDSVFVARISENALTAVSSAFPMQNLVISAAVGFGVGINALLSRALGEKNNAKAEKITMNGVMLEFFAYLIFLIVGLTLVPTFMRAQSEIEEIVQYGITYLRIVLIGSFGVFAEITFERLAQSTGRARYSMYIQLLGAGLNIILDPILIFGLFGLPKLGVAGAAYATIGGQIIAALFGYYLNKKKNPDINLTLRGFKPDWRVCRDISAISIPSILMSSIASVMTFILNIILFTFSSTAVAVFGVYFKLQSFVFMPVFGLNNGMVPIIAYNYGAKKPERIHQTIKLATIYAVTIMLIGISLFQLFPDKLLLMFKASEDMLAIGVPALRIISLHFIFAGVSIICSSTCQAFGYSTYSLIIAITRQLLVLIPVAYLLSLTGVLTYVWFAFPVAEVVSIILCMLFLRHVLKKTGMTKQHIIGAEGD